jgi:hypothetical protein
MVFLPFSPAIDRGDKDACVATSQHSLTRPVGATRAMDANEKSIDLYLTLNLR